MANKFLLLASFLAVITAVLSQGFTKKHADSARIELKKSKQDINRIDSLLSPAQFYIFKPGGSQMDFDSARVCISKAKFLNKQRNLMAVPFASNK